MAYAEQTTVSVERSRAEIERTVAAYGASSFASGWKDDGTAVVQFIAHGRRVRFILRTPDPRDQAYTHYRHSSGKMLPRDPGTARKFWEQACRSRWRALHLCIKAKLESVESGITTFETEFLPYTVMPDGRTVDEHVQPAISQAYESGRVPPLLALDG